MNKTKVGIVFAAIVLALVVSPAIPYSEAGDARKVTALMKNSFAQSQTKTIMIVGHDEPKFVPNVVHIRTGDSIRIINQDGKDGGLAHHIISIDEQGRPDGRFSTILQNGGDLHIEKFSEPGMYYLTDSAYTKMQAILVVG